MIINILEVNYVQLTLYQHSSGKQNPLQSVELGEAQEDAYGPQVLDAQSEELPPIEACLSPRFFGPPSLHSTVQPPGGLTFPDDDDSFPHSINLPDQTSTTSIQDHYLNISNPHTLPASSLPSNLPGGSSTKQYLARSASITSSSQDSSKLAPTPPSDYSSSTSEQSTPGWLSPLHIAAQRGHDRIARILLEHNTDCNEIDSDGLTPIIHAVIGGHEDVVSSLLVHGACIVHVGGRQRPTALHMAILYQRLAILKILLDCCAERSMLVDPYDDLGRTPLHIAIDAGFEAGVLLLLQFGANPQYKTRKS